jgi:uncharacterized cupin superfamily protein
MPNVIRMIPDGDPVTGLTPGKFAGPALDQEPVEARHNFFEAPRDNVVKVRAAVYEGSAYSEKVEDYPYDEIMFITSGVATITNEDGTVEEFGPGECVFMPMGFNGIWKQSDNLKKFAMLAHRG